MTLIFAAQGRARCPQRAAVNSRRSGPSRPAEVSEPYLEEVFNG